MAEEVEEVVEEVAEEAFLLQYQQPPTGETDLLATRHSYSQGIAPSQRNS